jgi:hypothetical protein
MDSTEERAESETARSDLPVVEESFFGGSLE